jgi:hypothetical protein
MTREAHADVHMETTVTPTLRWGSAELFSAADVPRLLDYCERNNVTVLGIEGFLVKDNRRVPHAGAIADYSELDRVRDGSQLSVDAARNFFASIGNSDLLFEFELKA